jgi:hypothetical protein
MMMFERRTFERELADLQVGSREYETRLAATEPYYPAAEPLFSDKLRRRFDGLLDDIAVQKAVVFNTANHPTKSEIDLDTLRVRLENYIDRATLVKQLPANVDAPVLLAQLVNQFQRKCFREPGFQTGKLDEQTLDALGFIRHRGKNLNKADADGSKEALKSIKKAWDPSRVADLPADLTKDNWFSFMVDAPFLGLTTRKGEGVHVELMRRLRLAQRYLMTLFPDLSPVELGDKLLWDPVDGPATTGAADDQFGNRHRGNRRGKVKTPMHYSGMAIDLGYRSNPWINTATFAEISGRAAAAAGGVSGKKLDARALDKLSSKTTGEIWDELAKWNGWLKQYLAGTGSRVTKDIKALHEKGRFLWGRKPQNGFLSLQRDLVIALRDHACLAWGACDFGKSASGDVMHFDCRVNGMGRAYLIERNKVADKAGHLPPERVCDDLLGHPTIDLEWKAAKLKSGSGALYRLDSKASNSTVGVYIPSAAAAVDPLTVLVYLHGDLGSCSDGGSDALSMMQSATFPLTDLVDASRKAVVLVAPNMKWKKKQGSHRLGSPAAVNQLIDEVLGGLAGSGWSSAPSIGRLILAGHSHAFAMWNGLPSTLSDGEWSKGAMAALTDIWMFDSTYANTEKKVNARCQDWFGFAKAKPSVCLQIFYRKKTSTAALAECIEKKAAKLTNVNVTGFNRRTLEHCPLPADRLPDLLRAI